MRNKNYKRPAYFRLTAAAALVLSATAAMAGGFQEWEQGGELGLYHAGAAVTASAGNEFYNPALPAAIGHSEISVGGAFVQAKLSVEKGTTISSNGQQFVLTHDENGGGNNLIPNFHAVYSDGNRWAAALGITVPFGIESDYSKTDTVKYGATLTKIQAININPSLSYKLNNHVYLGFGFDMLSGEADYNSVMPGSNVNFTNNLDDVAFGFNAGALFKISPITSIGVSYRSKISLDASGQSSLFLPGQPPFGTTTATAKLPLPATTIISFSQKLSHKATILASAFYTQWDALKAIKIKNTEIGDVTDDKNFKNTWNIALGLKYKVNDKWVAMLGLGHDQTPTQDGYRDVRMPDADHTVVSFGAKYLINKQQSLSVGYAHVFIPEAKIDDSKSDISNVDNAVGSAKSSANLVSLQYNWSFE